MSHNKRPRGRPRGSGKNDLPHLNKVASLMIADSTLKPSTAMKCVIRSTRGWSETDETLLRRWQSKWRQQSQALLAAAGERAKPRCSVPAIGGDYVSKPASVLFEDAIQQLIDEQRRLNDLIELPYLRQFKQMGAIQRLIDEQRRLFDLINPPYHRKFRRMEEEHRRMMGRINSFGRF